LSCSDVSRLQNNPCDSCAINICFFNAAQEQLETSSKEETKRILYMQGLVGANLHGKKSVNNKNILSVEKHVRKLRAGGLRNQIAP